MKRGSALEGIKSPKTQSQVIPRASVTDVPAGCWKPNWTVLIGKADLNFLRLLHVQEENKEPQATATSFYLLCGEV